MDKLIILCLVMFGPGHLIQSRTEYLLMFDQTSCYQCNNPNGCQDPVEGADQILDAVNWTLNRMDTLNIVSKNAYGIEIEDTCSQQETAAWKIIKTLGRLSLEGSVNSTKNLNVILASQLNMNLTKEVSQLQMESIVVNPTSVPILVQAASQLVRRLSWTQVIIISTSQFSVDLMSSLAREKICVLASVTLPSAQAHKDAFTELLSRVEDTGVTRVIVSGNSADIARLVKNVYELNINVNTGTTMGWFC